MSLKHLKEVNNSVNSLKSDFNKKYDLKYLAIKVTLGKSSRRIPLISDLRSI